MSGSQCLTQANNGACTVSSYKKRCTSIYGPNNTVGTACCPKVRVMQAMQMGLQPVTEACVLRQNNDSLFASHVPLATCGVYKSTASKSCSGPLAVPSCCCYVA